MPNASSGMNACATAIAEARLALAKLPDYPGAAPGDIDEALDLQDGVLRLLDDTVVGWKIGCTSVAAQSALGADGPFFGPLLASRRYGNGATVKTGEKALRIIEAEVAITVGRRFAPKSSDYALDEVLEGISTVHPAIEIIDRRLPGGLDQGLMWNIADGGVNDAIVLGEGQTGMDPDEFAKVAVAVSVNGDRRTAGVGANALGGAHMALLWLVNEFSKRHRTLEAGHTVTTGLLTDIFMAVPGDHVAADFTELGTLEVAIE